MGLLFLLGPPVDATCVAACLIVLAIVVDRAVASRRSTRVLFLRVPHLAMVDMLGAVGWPVKARILYGRSWSDRLTAVGGRRREYDLRDMSAVIQIV